MDDPAGGLATGPPKSFSMLSLTASMLPDPSLPFYRGVQLALAIYASFILVIDESKIKAKTTPLAPSNCMCGKKMKLITPVTNAVARITNNTFEEPYFSSNNGPTTKSIIIFPKKCSHPECPNTCPKNLIYVSGLNIEDLYTLKKDFVEAPPVILSITKTAKQINVNPNTTGALKDSCNFLPLELMFSLPIICKCIKKL